MSNEIITFGNIETEKHKFHQDKNPISIYDVDINKIIVSNKVPFGKKDFKCFIGYKDVKKVRLLCIILPKVIVYTRDIDETKYMSFLIKNEELLENIIKFGIKSSILLKKDLIVNLHIMKF